MPNAPAPKHSEADAERIAEYHAALRDRVSSIMNAPDAQRIQEMPSLGRAFFQIVERGIPEAIEVFLAEGMPVNFQDQETGQTALHVAAAAQARWAIRLLIDDPDCDFLLRDKHGRLSSELAYLYGRDPALARLLTIKERKQADAQGITLTRRR